ncbi:MAG TPA: polyprenyl synthetase family protein [Marinilabiliaceae bacterium]|nr:polyprenyl synthetase family protein [Marinilabiliaceae bacterium]
MTSIDKYREIIEKAILKLPKEKKPEGLYSPIDYILSLGGKRIRPALCLAGTALFNEEAVKQCIPTALGLEIFHNFTLLHDDIMDKSPIRRNKPTVHERWNDNTAILSGDAMLIQAYQFIAQSPISTLQRVLTVFNQTAIEVCEGQQYDMDFETRSDVTETEYLEMIRLKTGVLLGASLKIGAIIGGATNQEVEDIYDFGVTLGVCFQLQDDWLDVFGSQEKFGKPIGGDILNNKKTFLLINALNHLEAEDKDKLIDWTKQKTFSKKEKIEAVKELYEKANASASTKELMDEYYKKSMNSLERIKGKNPIKNELISFSNLLMQRSR